MGLRARSSTDRFSRFETVASARNIIRCEAAALQKLSGHIPHDFVSAVNLILGCRGSVIVTGMGKAGWIGQKISASLCSTGTRSHFMHPAEAFHGDLGCVGPDDVVLAFSNSGETGELVQILPTLERLEVPLIAITSRSRSTLANYAQLILDYPVSIEAGHLGLAPSTSTTVMLALGDALTLVVSEQRRFRDIDFARFHPGGSLGKKLSNVDDLMRPISECRTATEEEKVRDVYVRSQSTGRRVGVILVLDPAGKLLGVFTDSDLARLLEKQQDSFFDEPIQNVMSRDPVTIDAGVRMDAAVETLACNNLSELPVIDSSGRAVGMLDITDVVGLLPR